MNVALLPNSSPANPWLAHTAVIESVTREFDEVATYRLRLLDEAAADAFRFRPGQFNMLYVPGCGESAISLSGDAANAGELLHTIRVVGRVTDAIARMPVGGQIGLRGPYGSSWPLEQCWGREVILVAGGIGLAPLRPVIYSLLARRDDVRRAVLLYGARTPDTLLYAGEFADWEQRGLEVQTTVDRASDAWTGRVGVTPLLLDRLEAIESTNAIVLACGPEVMLDYSVRSARLRGLDRDQIWLSMERNMQCAVGLCGHCQLGPAFVCRNGPVFRFDAIEPYLHVRDL